MSPAAPPPPTVGPIPEAVPALSVPGLPPLPAPEVGPAAPPSTPSEDPTIREAEEDVEKALAIVAGVNARLAWNEQCARLTAEIIELELSLSDIDQRLIANAERTRELAAALPTQGNVNPPLNPERILTRAEANLSQAEELFDTSSARLAKFEERRDLLAEVIASRRDDPRLAKKRLDQARRALRWANNPLAPRNIRYWIEDHVMNLGAIFVLTIVLSLAVRLVGRRIVHAVARHGARGSAEERDSRAHTLVTAFEQAASLTFLIGGLLVILNEIGIPVAPLVGGAAVFGVGIAFGAQNLIRDFFQGFMSLLENQSKLNDVVQIGVHSGLVEAITLRVTTLRGIDGTLHLFPNGQINVVGNLTHGWSRAHFEIGVAYKEDVDRVMDVLRELGAELRRDPEFAPLIRADLEMLGVEAFADSAIIIKFYILTPPVKQWTVKREFLRRTKRRFDGLGIEFPLPHQTTFHRFDSPIPISKD